MKGFLTLLFVSIFFVSSFAQTQPSKQSGFSDEEYRVWAEIFCALDVYLEDVNLSVIRDKTIPMTVSLDQDVRFVSRIRDYYTKAKLPDVTTELIQDFNEKNDLPYALEKKFVGCKNYSLVTESELSAIFDNSTDGWNVFKHRYPKSYGFRRFSRIGLSPNKKQAVIFVQSSCGWLCGSVDYYFFVKKDGEWNKQIRENVLVS